MEALIYTLIIFLVIFLITTLPLYFSVKLMGGRTTLIKTFFVMLLGAVINLVVYAFLPFATIISFILLIWLYREFFRLKWLKAFLVWIIQLVLIALFGFILAFAGALTISSLIIF